MSVVRSEVQPPETQASFAEPVLSEAKDPLRSGCFLMTAQGKRRIFAARSLIPFGEGSG
jgi:hypothetical protein